MWAFSIGTSYKSWLVKLLMCGKLKLLEVGLSHKQGNFEYILKFVKFSNQTKKNLPYLGGLWYSTWTTSNSSRSIPLSPLLDLQNKPICRICFLNSCTTAFYSEIKNSIVIQGLLELSMATGQEVSFFHNRMFGQFCARLN